MRAQPFHQDSIQGFLHEPQHANGSALVLTHGAGGNCDAPLLVAVATAFCNAGYGVLRCNLPFRQRRKFGPPFPQSAAEDRAALKAAAGEMRDSGQAPVFMGGHSYGGRQASMLASEQSDITDGLLLLSYPLHPPNKPAQLRTAHFAKLQTPALFIHGTNDPFGSIEELQSSLQLIPARTNLVAIEKAGHDLARGKFDIETLVLRSFEALLRA